MSLCKKCGIPHHNFMSCEQGAIKALKPDKFTRSREGERDWGNSFHTMQGREHGNVIISFVPRDKHPMYIKPEPPKAA